VDELRYCPRCAGALRRCAVDQPDIEHPVCSECGFVLWQNLKASVEALITRGVGPDAELLLGRRSDADHRGTWDAPGGFLNTGDTIEAALIRECRRELGVDVEIGRLVGVYEEQFAGSTIVSIVYECRALRGEPTAGVDFVDDARWFALDEPPAITFPSIERAIRDLARRHATD
jgi:ADP-ribose pyrophosphatase YjhB (NUDIX family)